MGIKLKDVRQAYYDYSKKASEVVRHLGFAGIALIWIFRTDGNSINGNSIKGIPEALIPAGLCLVVGLALDLLHCIVPTGFWGWLQWAKGKTKSPEDEIDVPRWINWPAILFFWTKIIAIVMAYILIIIYLISQTPQIFSK